MTRLGQHPQPVIIRHFEAFFSFKVNKLLNQTALHQPVSPSSPEPPITKQCKDLQRWGPTFSSDSFHKVMWYVISSVRRRLGSNSLEHTGSPKSSTKPFWRAQHMKLHASPNLLSARFVPLVLLTQSCVPQHSQQLRGIKPFSAHFGVQRQEHLPPLPADPGLAHPINTEKETELK